MWYPDESVAQLINRHFGQNDSHRTSDETFVEEYGLLSAGFILAEVPLEQNGGISDHEIAAQWLSRSFRINTSAGSEAILILAASIILDFISS
jgi:hypothetical protein